jgi:hypothetical protein
VEIVTAPASNTVVRDRPVAGTRADGAERGPVVTAVPVTAGRQQDRRGVESASSPSASAAGGVSSPADSWSGKAASAAPAGLPFVPAQITGAPVSAAIAAAPATLEALPRRRVGGDVAIRDGFAAPVSGHAVTPARPRFDVAAAPPVVLSAFDVSRPHRASGTAVAVAPVSVPAGAVGAGGVAAAAAAAGSAASGAGLWLLLAALASIAIFFSRVRLVSAVSRPVPFISLLERPG